VIPRGPDETGPHHDYNHDHRGRERDAERFAHLLFNVTLNAWVATPSSRQLSARLARSGRVLRLCFASWGYEVMDKPTNTPYFYKMIVRLKQHHYLTIAHQKSPLLPAWACRNLSEVNVVTRYCPTSRRKGRTSRTT
jgi:hypothetical protein